MKDDARNLRLRVQRREESDMARLMEWVLNVAETRHRAWPNGEPDSYALPPPDNLPPVNSSE